MFRKHFFAKQSVSQVKGLEKRRIGEKSAFV